MANYEQLKAAVNQVIKENGNEEITGAILQNTLNTIISTIGDNATFAGIALPATVPGTPDQNVFYLAVENGIYSNFNGYENKNNNMVLFSNKTGAWVPSIILDFFKQSIFWGNIGYVNKYFGTRDDSTSGTEYRSTFFLKIEDKNNLKVSGFSGATNQVALIGFYDRSLNFLGYYNTETNGNVTNVTIPVESIPEGAYYVKASRNRNVVGSISGVNIDFSMITIPNEDLPKTFLWENSGHINKYNGDIDVSSGTDYQYSKFLRIINKSYLFITTGYSGVENSVALVSFYDKNLNWLGYYNAPTNGAVTSFIIPSVQIPTDAVFVRFTKRGISVSYIYGVDFDESLGFETVTYLVDRILQGNAKDATKLGYISKVTGDYEPATATYRSTNFYTITNRTGISINTGFSGATNNVALVAFYDDNINFLGYYNTETNGIVTNVTIPVESIPTGTKYLRFTTTNPEGLSIKGAKKYQVNMLEIERYVKRIVDNVVNNMFLAPKSELFNEIGYINKTNGKFDTSGASYRSSLFLKLNEPTNLYITGYSGVSNNAALVSFYDKNLNWLGYYNAPTNGNVTNHKVEPENIPSGTYYVRFTRTQTQSILFTGATNEIKPVETWKLIDTVRKQIPDVSNLKSLRSGKPNPDKGGYLKFLNYLGNNQNIHPKVLFFESGFNGYKYWMAYTPYPGGNVEYENPCIAASNDGMNWETPTGLTNPLELRPVTEQDPTAYNSDTHLVYNSDTLKLECWWRSYNGVTPCIKRRVSLNGINWEPTEIIFNYGGASQVSQAIIYENGIYKYWAVNAGNIIYTESSDVFNFPAFTTLPIEFSANGLTAWHMDVIKTAKGYEFVVQCWETGVGNNNTSDLYYVLYNGSTYSTPRLIVERGDLPTDDDYMGIYRASIVWHPYNANAPRMGGYYFIYYSALGRNYANRNIFLTAGRSVDRLRGINM